MNELAIIFDRLGIPTQEVLRAAAKKWSFLPFTPGLGGGHCIGVDAYYPGRAADYYPQVILSGRRINDGGMGRRNPSANRVRSLLRSNISPSSTG